MKRSPTTKQQASRTGVAAVETALVLPVFFLALAGIIEFGRAMMVSNVLTHAAREGARIGASDGSSNTEIREFVQSFCQQSLGVAPGDLAVTIAVTVHPDNNNPGTDVLEAEERDTIDVRVAVPFAKVSYIPGNYLADATLTGVASTRHE